MATCGCRCGEGQSQPANQPTRLDTKRKRLAVGADTRESEEYMHAQPLPTFIFGWLYRSLPLGLPRLWSTW